MRTREEYLIDYESKLINQYSGIFKSQGKNIFTIYIIACFYLLFAGGFIKEINLFGNKILIGIENLKLFLPFILFCLYAFVNYQTIRVAKIIQKIRVNSNEILKVNPNSKPLSTDDMFFFSSGLSGLILAFSMWQFGILVKQKFHNKYQIAKNESSFIFRILNLKDFFYSTIIWITFTLLSLSLILILYLLPLIMVLIDIASTTEIELFNTTHKVVAITILSLAILSTIISIIALLFLYLNNLIENIKKELEQPFEDIKKTFISRVLFRLMDFVIKVFKDIPHTYF